MRSPKSRSRAKGNRRPQGNVINRVFDSSGPEGKVRGTPQQIIEKYTSLARDAQLGNDRVAAENFQQHAEHYIRLLAEAMREQEARRERQEAQQNQQTRQENDDDPAEASDPSETADAESGSHAGDRRPRRRSNGRTEARAEAVSLAGGPVESDDGSESGLVETPESGAAGQPVAQGGTAG
jgi:hypothetical protein